MPHPLLRSQSATVQFSSNFRSDRKNCVALINGNRTKAEMLAYCCEKKWGFKVVSSVTHGTTALAAIENSTPDLLIISYSSTDFGFAHGIEKIRRCQPKLKTLALITCFNDCLIHLLSSSGHEGLIWEGETGLDDLGQIARSILDGVRFSSSAIVQCQKKLRSSSNAFPKLLTKREIEILGLISRCLSDKEIGVLLDCSPSTVLCHRRKLMRKLDIHSTPKLIRFGLEKGFDRIPLDEKITERKRPAAHKAADLL